ncbi:inositol monophosphatase [Rhizobium anhuiense]|jgi:myo-inositol-1(or 4)-monophosphatase|uniref:Inositol-1-monophosphatase n=1 Tax=Rhizobium anhuiense TaxID=1184720 RepID=A0A3S0QIQ3_9HYPH|nr:MULTISPECIES: inositol monophosphatase family protein [Rhizobium]MBB3298846.1 myo-inositol-1(or 4)-monophosphatase [Rhizobium sp. BK112]MBB3367246.1 myo-inositol-1(or 4)-monophosphatase [Rhizobium sp. BK077]MBB3742074.1 myo-inositol-1(or 4)-monophosphatase [Rhizobium sp. BK591]MBB4111908.1 myo-inositol-1(or 4)-monophosphatase [Rhizobium sp. BK226]MBB4178738.1 myo-inositol-1(or 4)-monophosphatase [Rhizobium sp. BK109]
MSQQTELDTRFVFAKAVAREAGAMALDYFNGRDRLVIETKRDLQDVVSIADRNVETFIRERVAEAFGADGFLGEEYGYQEGGSGLTWVVDPIDGTAPFVNGMPTWCVSIAVLHRGMPVIGVIHVPCDDELYAAAAGMGASLNGKKLSLDPSRTLQNAMTGIGCNSYVTPERVGAIVSALLAKGGNFIRNGSGALMLAYVAAGRLVGYYEPHMRAWDCMAGYCLVKEAGGTRLAFPAEGEALLQGHPVLASNPTVYADLLAIHTG